MDEKAKIDKLKNDAPRLNNILFVVLWVAGHAASWVVALLINRFLTWQGIYIQSNLLLGMLMALGTGIPTAIVQLMLVERGLKKKMRGWIPVSVVGWFLSGLAFYLMWANLPGFYNTLPYYIYGILPRLMFLPLFVPVAVVQWLWLRRKVKSAGLWMIAALAGALLFALPGGTLITGTYYYVEYMEYVITAAAALLYSGATGATMYYLWSAERAKAKNDAAAASLSAENDAARLERLQDTDGTESHVNDEVLRLKTLKPGQS